jgi:hypothetical protein
MLRNPPTGRLIGHLAGVQHIVADSRDMVQRLAAIRHVVVAEYPMPGPDRASWSIWRGGAADARQVPGCMSGGATLAMMIAPTICVMRPLPRPTDPLPATDRCSRSSPAA